MFPNVAEGFVFDCRDNPVSNTIITNSVGHDFALINRRYVVDHWLRAAFTEKVMVLDLHNPADHALLRERYGDASKWERFA